MLEHPRTNADPRGATPWRLGAAMLACGVTLGAFPCVAHAEPGQWRTGAGLGAAWLDHAGVGPALAVFLGLGLSSSVDVQLQSVASLHPFQNESNPAWALGVGPALGYRWDVLRWVPYVRLGAAYYRYNDSEARGGAFGGPLALGVDYLISRALILNVQATAHVFIAPDGPRLPWAQLSFGAAHGWGE